MRWYKGGNIYLEHDVLINGAVGFSNGKILHICSANEIPSDQKVISLSSNDHLLPGCINFHLHGLMGSDIMDGTPESLEIISKALYQDGVTGFLAATMSEPTEKIKKAIKNATQFKKPDNGAELLGIYLEGPFLSEEKTGAQDPQLLKKPSIEGFKAFEDDIIKVVAIAPEEDEKFNLIRYLNQKNYIISIGHTNASVEITQQAIEAGCSHATHLFNAMPEMRHREPGAVAACLLDDRVTVEILADGTHVHPAMIKLVYELVGPERIILVTDSMRATGLPDGDYELGGQKVIVKNQIARLENGALAGSVLTMKNAIKNMMAFTDCSFRDIIKMTSENPAKKLNLFHKKGSITIGKDADLIIANV